MYSSRRFVSICVAVLAGLAMFGVRHWSSSAATDTWIPVVSKMRETVTEIPSSGPESVTETWDGTYLRDFDGSEVRKLQRVSPSEPQEAEKGAFIDRSNQSFYDLDFSTRTAVLQQSNLAGREDPSAARAKALSLGREEEVFQGISCFVMPMDPAEFGGVTFSGKGCYSPEYDLHLYQVLSRTDKASGLTIKTVTEMYDLEVGRAPEPDTVKLPDGFVVQDSLCSACGSEP